MCCMGGIGSRGMPQTILNVPMTVWRVHVLHGGHRFQRHAQTIQVVLMTVWRGISSRGMPQTILNMLMKVWRVSVPESRPDHPEHADEGLAGISSRVTPRPS